MKKGKRFSFGGFVCRFKSPSTFCLSLILFLEDQRDLPLSTLLLTLISASFLTSPLRKLLTWSDQREKEADRGPGGEPDPQEELICTEFTAREAIEFQHETSNLKRYGLDCRSPLERTHGGRRDRSTGTSLSTLIV